MDNDWILQGSTEKYSVKGDEFESMLRWLGSREGALAVAQGYEAFEIFLYDITSNVIQVMGNEVASPILKGKLPETPNPSTEDWKRIVRSVFRRKPNHPIITALRGLGADLDLAEAPTNNRKLSMKDWFVVGGHVRHATTHTALIIKPYELKKMNELQRKILEIDFPGVLIDEGYRVEMNTEYSTFAIQLFAEYGHAIYKSLSISAGVNWDKIDD